MKHCTPTHTQSSLSTAKPPKPAPRRLPRGAHLGNLLWLGPVLSLPAQAQLPNPFCNAFTIGLAWIGGIVGVAVLVYGAQLVLRHFFGHMGGDLTRGALTIAGGLFILGLLMNNGAGLAAVAQAFGFTGFTLGCGS